MADLIIVNIDEGKITMGESVEVHTIPSRVADPFKARFDHTRFTFKYYSQGLVRLSFHPLPPFPSSSPFSLLQSFNSLFVPFRLTLFLSFGNSFNLSLLFLPSFPAFFNITVTIMLSFLLHSIFHQSISSRIHPSWVF